MRKLFLSIALAGMLLIALAVPAGACHIQPTCDSFTVVGDSTHHLAEVIGLPGQYEDGHTYGAKPGLYYYDFIPQHDHAGHFTVESCEPTTTTTIPPTTTTTVAPTTTTTVAPTTTTIPVTTTTVKRDYPPTTTVTPPSQPPTSVHVTPPSQPVAPPELPHTGSNSGVLAWVGIALLGGGALALASTKRKA